MPRKTPAKPKPTFVPMTAAEAMEGAWMVERKTDEDGLFAVFVFGQPLDDGSFERFVLARCPSIEVAREIVSARELSQSATNLVGAMRRAIEGVQESREAVAYSETFTRAVRNGMTDNRAQQQFGKPLKDADRWQKR